MILLDFAEVVSGKSYLITGFSGEKMNGWIDVADRIIGKMLEGFLGQPAAFGLPEVPP